MITDNILRYEAINILTKTLGPVDTERFICMIKRDTFDYTKWRRNQWNDMTIEDLFAKATEYEKSKAALHE